MPLRRSLEGLLEPESAYTVCSWPLAYDYVIFRGGIWPSSPEGHPEYEKDRTCLIYSPLERPELFLSFARLAARGRPSRHSVLKWVSCYGLLKKKDKEQPAWSYEDKDPYLTNNQAPMKLEDFIACVERARAALELHSELQKGDVHKVLSRVRDPQTHIDDLLQEQVTRYFAKLSTTSGAALQESLSQSERDELLLTAAGVLADEINEHISEVKLVAEPSDQRATVEHYTRRLHTRIWNKAERGEVPDEFPHDPLHRFKKGWRCPDLLSAIYFQFYLMVTENNPLRRCENPRCNIPFEASRKDKRFCNPSCKSSASYHRRKDQ